MHGPDSMVEKEKGKESNFLPKILSTNGWRRCKWNIWQGTEWSVHWRTACNFQGVPGGWGLQTALKSNCWVRLFWGMRISVYTENQLPLDTQMSVASCPWIDQLVLLSCWANGGKLFHQASSCFQRKPTDLFSPLSKSSPWCGAQEKTTRWLEKWCRFMPLLHISPPHLLCKLPSEDIGM